MLRLIFNPLKVSEYTLPQNDSRAKRGFCFDTRTQEYVAPGNTFDRRSPSGQIEMCRCLGQGRGSIQCVLRDETCIEKDSALGTWRKVGEEWLLTKPNGQEFDCICVANGRKVSTSCSTGDRCFDKQTSTNYHKGESWKSTNSNGKSQVCHCEGFGATVTSFISEFFNPYFDWSIH